MRCVFLLQVFFALLGSEAPSQACIGAPPPPSLVQNMSLLHVASMNGDIERVTHLLGQGVDPNTALAMGITPLMLAAQRGHTAIVRALVQGGADTEAIIGGRKTALLLALAHRHLETAFLLIELGANINPPILGIETPLWWAITLKEEALVDRLIVKGAGLKDVLNDAQRAWYTQQVRARIDQWLSQIDNLQALNQLRLTLGLSNFKHIPLDVAICAHFQVPPSAKQEEKASAEEIAPVTCICCADSFQPTSKEPKGLAGCACVMCPDCHAEVLQRELAKETLHCCPSCQQEMHADTLRRMGKTEAEVQTWYIEQMRRKLGALPNWAFCKTANCPNGMVQMDVDQRLMSCALCGKDGCLKCGESHTMGKCGVPGGSLIHLQEIEASKAYLRQLVAQDECRPCYHCGILTQRIAGCNAIQCSNCKKSWHWNEGASTQHDREAGPQRYIPKVQMDL